MAVAVSPENPVIAVVDDDRSVCTGVQRLLRASGLSTVAFTSGTEFLESLAVATPDCIVLDLSMPEIDGLAVGPPQWQRRDDAGHFSFPRPNMVSRAPALAAGAFTFLQKPFDGQLLLDAIASALSTERRNR